MMIKNLKARQYEGRTIITNLIDSVYKQAKVDAYQLSMPLLASAQQGNQQLYNEIKPIMIKELNHITNEKNSFKAWLLGRVLLAADYVGDNATSEKVKFELKLLLNEKNMPQDAFSAWAWGYLASLNNDEYKQSKNILLSKSLELTEKYKITRTDDLATDAMWAWVMDVQAAANAGDKQTYEYILSQIKQMTGQSSIEAALSVGLKPNDYPAWAFSIVFLSAATIQDEIRYNELKKPLLDSIEVAKNSGIKPEEMLAQVNLNIGALRWEESHLQKTEQKNNSPAFMRTTI